MATVSDLGACSCRICTLLNKAGTAGPTRILTYVRFTDFPLTGPETPYKKLYCTAGLRLRKTVTEICRSGSEPYPPHRARRLLPKFRPLLACLLASVYSFSAVTSFCPARSCQFASKLEQQDDGERSVKSRMQRFFPPLWLRP